MNMIKFYMRRRNLQIILRGVFSPEPNKDGKYGSNYYSFQRED